MRKRWIALVFLVACAAYWVWPYVGAYGLAEAAARQDTVSVAARVDFPALRHSLAHQVVQAYLHQSGRANKLGPYGRGLAISLGTTVADPYLTQLLAPETITALLGNGHLTSVTVDQRTITFDEKLTRLPDLLGGDVIPVLFSSYYDGLTSFAFHKPGAGGDDYGVHLKLSGTTWMLSGVDLPQPLVDRLAAEIVAKEQANKPS